MFLIFCKEAKSYKVKKSWLFILGIGEHFHRHGFNYVLGKK
jgi:hypothetical protein